MSVRSTQIHGLIGLLQQVIDFCEADPDYVDEDLNHWAEAAGFCYAAQDELHYALRDSNE